MFPVEQTTTGKVNRIEFFKIFNGLISERSTDFFFSEVFREIAGIIFGAIDTLNGLDLEIMGMDYDEHIFIFLWFVFSRRENYEF
jgi:hypothetical protein